jgi:lysophospholipase L1-like esterase
MHRNSILRSLRICLLSLVAAGFAAPALAQAPVRIMPLGDSITAGPGCWRAYLWNQLQTAGYHNIDFVGGVSDGGGCNPGFSYDFHHEGHSGFSITGIADGNQLPPWLSAANPQVIVMHLGTNDMWGGWIPLQTKLTALTKLIGQMRAHNPAIRIVVSQIIPMSPSGCATCASDVVAFNNAIPGLVAGLNSTQSPIYIVDQWTGFDLATDTYDAVHPVTSGFIKMANRFFPVVAQALNAGTPATFTLAVTKSGAGAGTVNSTPAGISCGGSCSANYASGTSVTLTAAVASNSTFAGWSGACSGTGACTVAMTQARSVTATFNAQATYALAVTRTGTGAGTVTSSPAGINCGSSCSASFGGNASVTLTAAAASGSVFAGWSGACSGTGSCVLSMNQARNVTATFTGGGSGGSCANPVTFSGNSGNFNTTGAVCYRTNAVVNGWGCYNFDGRTLSVGGVARTCGQMPLTRAADGYVYFSVTAGQYPWAGLFTW